MKKNKALLLSSIFSALFIFFVSLVFIKNVNAAKLVLLEQDQTIDKTYFASGETLDIKGTINGDAFLAGSEIIVSGKINGNLFVVGNTLNIIGEVNGSIFGAGNVLTIGANNINSAFLAGNLVNLNSKINKNTYIAGNLITISNTSEIGQDLFASGSSINLNANIGRNLSIESSSASINSIINRDASIISNSISFNGNTKINNNLEILESSELSTDLNNVVLGEVIKKAVDNKVQNSRFESIKSRILDKLTFGLFAILITGLILIKFLPKEISNINKNTENNLLPNLGKGILFIIVTPIISLLLLITIIGVKLAFVVIGIYLLLMFFASIFASIFIGESFLVKVIKNKNNSMYLSLLIGVLIYTILIVIPFVGWIFSLLLTSLSIGSLISYRTNNATKLVNKKK